MKIGIIGNFGGGKDCYDGQTVKTIILYEELKNNTDYTFSLVDTYFLKHNPLKLIFETINCIFSCKDIVLIVSKNGKAVYFPILFFAHKLLGTRVYHNVIAGGLPDQTIKHKNWKNYLNSFCVNWVELEVMKKKLEEVGVNNCRVLANFKRVPIIKINEIKECGTPLKLCTFSRVMKEKGIEDAILAVESINKELGTEECSLEIYGQVTSDYSDQFKKLMKSFPPNISYKGMIPFDKSVDVIKDKDILLFPTHFKTEGFPGTLIDAYSAGLAVIASKIPATEELIDEWSEGILYPNKKVGSLREAIEWAVKNKKEINSMKERSLAKARVYSPENVVKQMKDDIDEFSSK